MAWQAYDEPLHVTIARTGLIALVIGVVVASLQGRPATWPHWAAFALWFSFGGHWVELFFLNWLRPRLSSTRWVQVVGRLFIWFVGGSVLIVGGRFTLASLSGAPMHLPSWWLGGFAFIGLELLVHTLLSFRGCPNFYNGLQ